MWVRQIHYFSCYCNEKLDYLRRQNSHPYAAGSNSYAQLCGNGNADFLEGGVGTFPPVAITVVGQPSNLLIVPHSMRSMLCSEKKQNIHNGIGKRLCEGHHHLFYIKKMLGTDSSNSSMYADPNEWEGSSGDGPKTKRIMTPAFTRIRFFLINLPQLTGD